MIVNALLNAGGFEVINLGADVPVDEVVDACKIPGTYFMTPGWTYHWKQIFGSDCCDMEPDMAKRMFTH